MTTKLVGTPEHYIRNQSDFSFCQEDPAMGPIFYTVRAINGDYADLVSDDGLEHSITMFLLPEGTTLGSRLKFEDFQWELV